MSLSQVTDVAVQRHSLSSDVLNLCRNAFPSTVRDDPLLGLAMPMAGMIEVDSIELIPFSSIDADDLRRSVEADLESLKRHAAHGVPTHDGTFAYRVEFHPVG
jgi:hypothetical protein